MMIPGINAQNMQYLFVPLPPLSHNTCWRSKVIKMLLPMMYVVRRKMVMVVEVLAIPKKLVIVMMLQRL